MTGWRRVGVVVEYLTVVGGSKDPSFIFANHASSA